MNMKDNYQTEAECEAVYCVPCIGTQNLTILQTEAGGGEREASRRKTRRPKSLLARKPRRIHAPVHQVCHHGREG